MNKSNSRRTAIKLLALTAILGSFLTISSSQPKSDMASAWSGTQTSTEGTYYSTVSSETGDTLKSKLKGLISSGTNESYDWSRYEAADESMGDSSKVLLIYSRQNVAKTAHVSSGIGWNREHTFAKSLFGETAPAVNDNHHIFADDNKTNSNRGNKPFNELDKSTSKRSTDSYGNTTDCYYTSSYFMPNDLAKGEVARATMYMNTRYDYSVTLNFYSVALMLEWHLNNPVTDHEIYRNNTIYTMQYNRNPYIDHPEYACKVWGDYNSATKAVCSAQQSTPTIELDKTTASVNIGNTTKLTATVTNSSSSVSWSSSNTSIATVNSSGTITGVSKGTATITASITEKSIQYTATCVISVKNPSDVDVTSVQLNKTNDSILVGETTSLTATVLPSNATINTIKWTTSNSAIASISSTTNKTITVTGASKGTATITATTDDGGFQASCSVTVTSNSTEETTDNLTSTKFGLNSYGDYTYDSLDSGASYAVYAFKGTGNVIQMNSSKNAGFIVTASGGKLDSVTINWSTNSGNNNRSVNIYGSNAAYDSTASSSITSTTSLGSLAYGESSNTYTFISDYAYFAFMPVGGGVYFTSIEVVWAGTTSSPTLSSISIASNPTKTSYIVGETLDLSGLKVKATYSDGSSDSDISGYTTSPAAGSTLNTVGTQVITVNYQGKSTSFNVTVNAANVAMTGVSLNTTSATLDINGTLSLSATINPTNAYPVPTINWSSSNSTVASVSTSGLVTALKAGSATITVTATQNAITKTATCNIIVNAAPFVPTTTYTEGGGVSTTATLVTSVDNLQTGDKIIIANTTNMVALGAANGTYRTSVDVTIAGNQITTLNNATILTLGGSSGAWTFSSGTEYLYYTGSKNTLNTGTSSSSGNTWKIEISSGITTITNVNSGDRKIQYNSADPRFACYTSSQQSPSIYKLDPAGVTAYNYNYLIDVLDGDYCTMSLEGLNLINVRYEAMTSIEKKHFNTVNIVGNDGNNYTGEQAYTFAMIKRTTLINQGSSELFENTFKQNEHIMIIVIVSIVGLSAIAGSLFVFKRKRNEN